MLEEDLRARVVADGGVRALMLSAASIAWGDRPQASALPGVTFEIIYDARPQHMAGFQELRSTQVQVDCWALDFKAARDLREALIAALVPVATVGGTRFGRSFITRSASSFEQSDAKTIIYRESIDFTIWQAAAS